MNKAYIMSLQPVRKPKMFFVRWKKNVLTKTKLLGVLKHL